MVLILILIMILAITLSSLRTTAIYKNRIILYTLLLAGVLTGILLTGLGEGTIEGLFQVTAYSDPMGLNTPPLGRLWLCKGLLALSGIFNEVQAFAMYVYCSFISKYIVLCEGSDTLPRLMEFVDLHQTESLKEAKTVLKEQSGVYCLLCQETGTMYIGSVIWGIDWCPIFLIIPVIFIFRELSHFMAFLRLCSL